MWAFVSFVDACKLLQVGVTVCSMCSWIIAWCMFRRHCSGSSLPRQFPPTPFPSLFPLSQQCDGCLFLFFCVGAHSWVARIYQPWEQSSSRSWQPIVEAPGCLRHPTSILATQLLTSPTSFSYMIQLCFSPRIDPHKLYM